MHIHHSAQPWSGYTPDTYRITNNETSESSQTAAQKLLKDESEIKVQLINQSNFDLLC